jgi:hypothetical protein
MDASIEQETQCLGSKADGLHGRSDTPGSVPPKPQIWLAAYPMISVARLHGTWNDMGSRVRLQWRSETGAAKSMYHRYAIASEADLRDGVRRLSAVPSGKTVCRTSKMN